MTPKTVLITGAAQRIGAAIACTLHQHGWDVVIHYRQSVKTAAALASRLNANREDSAITLQADLLDASAYTALIEQSYHWKRRLDALINNASAFYPTQISAASPEQWEELIGTNMKAPFFLMQQASTYLCGSKGAIINITDIHADRPLREYAVYCAAKAGLVMLTKALAKELAPEIRVNAVSPGAILWPEDMSEITQDDILARIPLKKTGTAADIANATRYLLEEASYVTGQVLAIDGGRSLAS